MDENDLKQRVFFFASEAADRYYLVDEEDIAQELWVWVTTHQDKIDRWDFDEHGSAKLNKALRNAAARYARREQRARRDIGPTDRY